MPFNGSGTFVSVAYPDYPAVAGTTIKAAMFNTNINDLITGLSNCITRDGQSPATQNLPMGGKRHTGVGKAASSTDYARFDQVVPLDSTGFFMQGDFSNATLTNRWAFQTTTVNGGTYVGAAPNGTSNSAAFQAFKDAVPTNSSYASFGITGTDARILSEKTGAGAYLPLTFYTGGAERLRFAIDGAWGLGGANYGTAGQVLSSNGPGAAPSWISVAGVGSGGDASTNTATSVASELALFADTSGKLLKRATGSGLAKLTSGVLGIATAGTDYLTPGALASSGLTIATSTLCGRTTAGIGAVEGISIGSGLSLSGGILACTVSGGVSSVGGNTGAVTNAQVSAAATAGYGYTPANPANYVKNNGSTQIGMCIGAVYYASGIVNGPSTPTVGTSYSGMTLRAPLVQESAGPIFSADTWTPSGTWKCLTAGTSNNGIPYGTFQCIS